MYGLIALGVLGFLVYESASYANEKKAKEAVIGVMILIIFFVVITWITEDIAQFLWR
jgi:hypothetical protein